MRPEDEHKIAFKTHHGHFEFKVMPYGVTGGPSTFQGGMHIVLARVLRHGVLALDDILVHTKELEAHKKLLRQVLGLLHQHGLKAKMSKCTFAQQKISYLGHIISDQGVATDSTNVLVVQQWPVPTIQKNSGVSLV